MAKSKTAASAAPKKAQAVGSASKAPLAFASTKAKGGKTSAKGSKSKDMC